MVLPTAHVGPLLDLLNALVRERGRTAAAQALGVNYRTLVNCEQSRRVSRRMRQVLPEFRDAGGVGEDEPAVVDGNGAADGEGETLEEENAGLRELVEGQARQLEELARQVATLEGTEEQAGDIEAVDVDDDQNHDQGQCQERDWRPPRRRPGVPDAGVVTVEEQPDEQHAFGPAATLVREWRELRVGCEQAVGRVDRARATVRRWELEVAMLGEYYLTLPPETYPWTTREGRTMFAGGAKPWRRPTWSWAGPRGCGC